MMKRFKQFLVLILTGTILLSCSKSDSKRPGNWPDLPVKSNLYFFASTNIQKLNLANGTLSNIGGADDKPDQSRAVDVSKYGNEIAFIFYDIVDGITIQEIRVLNNSGERLASIPLTESYHLIKISPDKTKFICKRLTSNTFDIIERNGNRIGTYSNTTSAAWTPDNRLVVSSATGEIFVSGASFESGNIIKNIGSGVKDLDVNDDGSKIAFYHAGNVWSMGIDGSNLQQLTQASLECYSPSWSKDGNHLAVLWGASQEQNHLSVSKVYLIPANEGTIDVSENSQKAIMLYEKWPTGENDVDYTEMGSRSQPMLR